MFLGVSEQLVDCSGGEIINEETGQKRKAQAALSLIKSNNFRRTVIFCNKIETCRMVCLFRFYCISSKTALLD